MNEYDEWQKEMWEHFESLFKPKPDDEPEPKKSTDDQLLDAAAQADKEAAGWHAFDKDLDSRGEEYPVPELPNIPFDLEAPSDMPPMEIIGAQLDALKDEGIDPLKGKTLDELMAQAADLFGIAPLEQFEVAKGDLRQYFR